MNPAPGFKKYPGHRVDTNPSTAHVKVMLDGEIIADTREAVELHESTGEGKKTVAPVVYYIPKWAAFKCLWVAPEKELQALIGKR